MKKMKFLGMLAIGVACVAMIAPASSASGRKHESRRSRRNAPKAQPVATTRPSVEPVQVENPDSWKDRFPLLSSANTTIPGRSGWHMVSNASLSADGRLLVYTETWTNNWMWGFTGGSMVVIYKGDKIIYLSRIRQFGVTPIGHPKRRTDSWPQGADDPDLVIPAEVVRNADRIEVLNFRCERPDRLARTLQQLGIKEFHFRFGPIPW